MKVLTIVATILFSTSIICFADELSVSSIKMSGSDEIGHVIIIVQKDRNGTYNIIKKGNSSEGPVGPLSQNMDCIIEGQSIATIDSIKCSKNNSEINGRIDTVEIKKNSNLDAKYTLTYSWINVKVETNKGSKTAASNLSIYEVKK